MNEVLQSIMLFAIHAAILALLFALLFLQAPRRWWLRAVTLVFGATALIMPYLFLPATLGYPNPWPDSGIYDVLGWKIDEAGGQLYILLSDEHDPVPQHYALPFELQTVLTLEQLRAGLNVYDKLSIEIAAEGTLVPPGYRFLVRER
jgi:hypothetical protein